jgi:hypothetical protein
MLNDAVAFLILDVHAGGKVRHGFHGQVRLDSSWPAGIYTHHVVASHRLPRFLRAAAARRPTYLDFIRSCHTLQNALALASYASVCTFNCRCNSSTPVPRASRASTSTVLMA